MAVSSLVYGIPESSLCEAPSALAPFRVRVRRIRLKPRFQLLALQLDLINLMLLINIVSSWLLKPQCRASGALQRM